MGKVARMKKTLVDAELLVVDDNPQNLELILGILQQEGYKLSYAMNAQETYNLVNQHHFDLILLDIMLPETDGIEICKILRTMTDYRDVPIIFITAKTGHQSLVEGFNAGGNDYINKPFEGAELKVRIKNHLELYFGKQELQEVMADRDHLYSIIAHDLRSPFNGLINLTKAIADNVSQWKPDFIKEQLYQLYHNSKGIYGMLEDLLLWTGNQSNRIQFAKEEVNLAEIIENQKTILGHQLEGKKLTLKSQVPTDLQVYTDRRALATVIRNLSSNAIKFSHPDSEIRWDVKEDKQRGKILCSIQDYGIGMDEEQLKDIAKISSQPSQEGTRGEKGSGLGLWVVKDFLDQQGEELRVSSQSQKGTCFTFTLPNS